MALIVETDIRFGNDAFLFADSLWRPLMCARVILVFRMRFYEPGKVLVGIMSAQDTKRTDHRIPLIHGVALYVGAVLGTGVIALPSLAARAAGPASLVAWAGLIVVSATLASVFAALASKYPDAGGVSAFTRRAFGDIVAAITGWWYFTATIILLPALGLFGGAYVAVALGAGPEVAVWVSVVMLAVTTATNMAGLRLSGRFQLALSSILAALVVSAVLVSAPKANTSNLTPFLPHGWAGVGAAAILLVWSFAGWEAVTHLSGEFAQPRRDIPRATAIAVSIVGVIYLAIAVATVVVLGQEAGQTTAPVAVLLSTGLGTSAKVASAVVAVIITLGTMNADLASAAKLGSALGKRGALPRWLGGGSEAGHVPRTSLVVISSGSAVVLAATAIMGWGTERLVLITSALLVAVYVAGTSAGLRLLPAGSRSWWAALLTLGFALVLLTLSGWYLCVPLAIAVLASGYLRTRHRELRSHMATASHSE